MRESHSWLSELKINEDQDTWVFIKSMLIKAPIERLIKAMRDHYFSLKFVSFVNCGLGDDALIELLTGLYPEGTRVPLSKLKNKRRD